MWFYCSLQQGQALKEKLFYGENSDIHKSLDRTFSGEGFSEICGQLTDSDIARQLTQQSEVSGELLKELDEIKSIRSELLSVKRERRELQQQARGLMKVVEVRGGEREREGGGGGGEARKSTFLLFYYMV